MTPSSAWTGRSRPWCACAFFEDMKLEEIARVTNTNLNTVKSRLYKSLRRLRELTEEEC